MKARAAIGLGMIFGSLAFFAGGGFVLTQAMDASVRAERQISSTNKQCLEYLNEIPSSSVVPVGDDVSIVIKDIKDPKTALSDASLAIMMCPTKKVENVCLGDKCQGPTDEVILKLKLVKK